MAARKERKSKQSTKKFETLNKTSGWLNIFRFGESYSNLLLGIIVVITTTILLVFLVKDRNTVVQNEIRKEVSSTSTQRESENTIRQGSITPVDDSAPTSAFRITATPSKEPTIKPRATLVPTRLAIEPSQEGKNEKSKIHTVANGENLWTIAEKYYKSGYNWTDISRVNNLSNPNLIASGMKLTIPDVTPKAVTVVKIAQIQPAYGPKISGSTYTVKKGDHLWGISVRAYGDGYKWIEIVRVNNLSNPNIIHPGTVLKLPKAPNSP